MNLNIHQLGAASSSKRIIVGVGGEWVYLSLLNKESTLKHSLLTIFILNSGLQRLLFPLKPSTNISLDVRNGNLFLFRLSVEFNPEVLRTN
jgi:hypothetical protein